MSADFIPGTWRRFKCDLCGHTGMDQLVIVGGGFATFDRPDGDMMLCSTCAENRRKITQREYVITTINKNGEEV